MPDEVGRTQTPVCRSRQRAGCVRLPLDYVRPTLLPYSLPLPTLYHSTLIPNCPLSPEFHACLRACAARQRLQRAAVRAALSSLAGHGFDQLDRTLIVHAALVADAYDAFHAAWLRAVQVGWAAVARLSRGRADGRGGRWAALIRRRCPREAAAGLSGCTSLPQCIVS